VLVINKWRLNFLLCEQLDCPSEPFSTCMQKMEPWNYWIQANQSNNIDRRNLLLPV